MGQRLHRRRCRSGCDRQRDLARTPLVRGRDDLDAAPFTLETIPDLNPDPARTVPSTGCDFGDTGHNPDDVAFTCNNKLIGARDMRVLYEQFIGSETYATARDYDGHGTHTASTATGNPDVEASIFGREFGEIPASPRTLMSLPTAPAATLAASVVTSPSPSTPQPPTVSTSSTTQSGATHPVLSGRTTLPSCCRRRRSLRLDVGGQRRSRRWDSRSPASVPWVTTVGASLQKKTYIAEVRTGDAELNRWSRWFKRDTGRYEGASITPGTDGQLPFVDAANHGNELCDPAEPFTGDITGKVVLCLRGGPAKSRRAVPWPTPVGPAWSSTTSTTSRTCSPTTT